MPLILGTNSIKDTGFNVANSVRQDDGSSDYFNRTPSSATNRKTFTISMWVKRGELGSSNGLLLQGVNTGNDDFALYFTSADKLQTFSWTGGTKDFQVDTQRVFRDTNAWYHIVFVADTTQATDSNRIKIYVNGVQETALENVTYPSENADLVYNSTTALWVGRSYGGHYFDGYIAEVVSVDGTALDPTSFGEFDEDSGIWKPISVSGLTFGTNGFYLDFENSGALGDDVSGNGNDFTVNNLTAIDQSTDTCTNNFATFNSLTEFSGNGMAEGNLKFTNSTSTYSMRHSTFALTKGKWYAEFKMSVMTTFSIVGISDTNQFDYDSFMGSKSRAYSYRKDGQKGNNGSASSYGDTFANGDIIGVAVDLDNNKIYFSKNGVFQNSGDPTSGATGTGSAFDIADGYDYCIGASSNDEGTDQIIEANFGSPPYAISSGNQDGDGYGNMEFAVPSGYYVLNSKNLAEYG